MWAGNKVGRTKPSFTFYSAPDLNLRNYPSILDMCACACACACACMQHTCTSGRIWGEGCFSKFNFLLNKHLFSICLLKCFIYDIKWRVCFRYFTKCLKFF